MNEFSSEVVSMKTVELNLPTFGFAVATRAMIGVGIGLLLSDRFGRAKRHSIAKTLLTIGAATTLPIAIAVFRGKKSLIGAVV
jgi:hypothetical protein